MIFGGFQKLTLLDYPGKVACTVFTKGCNFYCPFCHNAFLVDVQGEEESILSTDVLSYLNKRQGVLDGICITGGEPLLHDEIKDFIKEVKNMGFFVKLDTNGSFPEKLKTLIEENLIDYVAMDIKNSFEKYEETSGCENLNLAPILESIEFLKSGVVDYEFRTTVSSPLHTISDIEKIAQHIVDAKKYFLQNYLDSGHILGKNLSPIDEKTLLEMEKIAQKYVKTAQIRGK